MKEFDRTRRVFGAGRGSATLLALLLTSSLVACGGRSANPVSATSNLDGIRECEHLEEEKTANLRRIEDLEDERRDNRVRSATRIPGALIGSPISAIVLADPSLAVYQEIAAFEKRNLRLEELLAEKNCGAAPTPAARLQTDNAPPPASVAVAPPTTVQEPIIAPEAAAPPIDSF